MTTYQTLVPPLAAYPYQQYSDDDNITAWFMAYNQTAQDYLDYFNTYNLAVYTDSVINGSLLDWCAEGIYGMTRPVIPAGALQNIGAYNTLIYNFWQYNYGAVIGASTYAVATDDIFKRCMTWNFYKGDGQTFSVTWLKRRIMRWLIGENGSAPNVDNTYTISVTFGANRVVTIGIGASLIALTGGSYPGAFLGNQVNPDSYTFITESGAPPYASALAQTLQLCLQSGAVQLPFLFTYVVEVI